MQTGSWGGSGDSGAEDQVFSLCAPLLKRGPHKRGGGALLVSVPRDEPSLARAPLIASSWTRRPRPVGKLLLLRAQ